MTTIESMAEEHKWEAVEGGLVERFNRKTFNPENPADRNSLELLRSRGRARAYSFRNGYGNGVTRDAHDMHHRKCCSSTALRNLFLVQPSRERIILDVGCGDSADALIAASIGYKAYGIDLFPPTIPFDGFVRADAVESIPFADNSIYAVISQAMIDLVEPSARVSLYKEILRVLEPNGVLSQTGVNLHCGYGFNHTEEVERARSAGFRAVGVRSSGFVAVK